MDKSNLRKFREHYFPGNITESRKLMCDKFKEYELTERCARAWEAGQNTISPWFVKVVSDYDSDNIFKKDKNEGKRN